MSEYNVQVTVENPQPNMYYIKVNPERVLLDGRERNTIRWTMLGESIASFTAKTDVEFITNEGKGRFPFDDMTFTTPAGTRGVITATNVGPEVNETIYTYFLNAHVMVGEAEVVIRIDPETDNPPPPPGGP